MQAQHSPSPYIGLWSRLAGFERAELESALLEDRVLKCSLMRGTLHLVAAREYATYRAAIPSGFRFYRDMVRRLESDGVDVDGIRARLRARVAGGPVTRAELRALAARLLPGEPADWAGFAIIAAGGFLVNGREDGLFGRFQSTTYRLWQDVEDDPGAARRHVVAAYFRAFGPASRSDLAQWSGEPAAWFQDALDSLELIEVRTEDGRRLLDLADAPRVGADVPAPVRFLGKWDNLLLSHARRERVLPDEYRRVLIRKNGDLLPTFLVDGFVAGHWEAPLRGKAVLTLAALARLRSAQRRDVEAEAESLLAWLRPDAAKREVRWAPG
jgi:winged helix DNA-binding protein